MSHIEYAFPLSSQQPLCDLYLYIDIGLWT